MTQTKAPVVFIHGLWLHATSWGPWQDLFATAGYESFAPGWPGDADTVEGSRADPDSIANHGIDDVTNHYAAFIEGLPAKPVIIGHSFGGMIAEKLLGLGYGAAAILPVFKNPANVHKAVSLTAEQFRYSFGNAVSGEESDELYERWAIPAPAKPLFEAATANFRLHSPDAVDTGNSGRGPLLLTMGKQDHTVPEVISKSTLKQYRHSVAVTDLEEFDRGHSLVIDSGWREVADACLSWLSKNGL